MNNNNLKYIIIRDSQYQIIKKSKMHPIRKINIYRNTFWLKESDNNEKRRTKDIRCERKKERKKKTKIANTRFDRNVAASEHNNSSRRDVSFSNLLLYLRSQKVKVSSWYSANIPREPR